MKCILAWFYLLLHLISETVRVMFGEREVGANITGLLESAEFLEWLKNTHGYLYFQLQEEVVPAAQDVKAVSKEIETLEAEAQSIATTFETARATIKANIPRIEGEVVGGIQGVARDLEKPINRLYQDGQRRGLIAESEEKRKLLKFVSAGLAIPNFIAFSELLGIELHRLSLATLIFVPLGLFFSISASVGVHIGLTDFVRATRDYIVCGDRALINNLFPYGPWKDRVFLVSLLIVGCDTLFSSVGLLMALPPNVREQLFWQMAILFVSALASVVNVLLAWGIALQRISIDLRFKHEGAVEQEKIKQHEDTLQTALVAKSQLSKLQEKIHRKHIQLGILKRAAFLSYRRWFKELRARQREQQVVDRRNAIIAERNSRKLLPSAPTNNVAQRHISKPHTNGHS